MTRKQSTPDDEDPHLFQEMVGKVTPLPQNKIDPDSRPKKSPTSRRSTAQKTQSPFVERDYINGIGANETLVFVRDGVQHKIMAQLKKGQYPFEIKIDLHGCTIEEAGIRLQAALNSALTSNFRCILVVHGKGKSSHDNKPAIKSHVNQWLRDTASVLAFHSAMPKHGGTGALYVLLKRQRDK